MSAKPCDCGIGDCAHTKDCPASKCVHCGHDATVWTPTCQMHITISDRHASKKEHDQVVYDRDFFEAERDTLRLALKAARSDLADRDRTIYELNCSVQEAKRERDDARKAKGFTERERDAALEMVAQRDRRIAEFEAALRSKPSVLDCFPDLRAALSTIAQPATVTKDLFGPADDVIAAQGLLNAAPPSPAATKMVLPINDAKLTPTQEANGKRDVAFEDAAENEAPSPAAREAPDEKARADHWMAVALAFRDATTDAATEARDGERDPYLERAQDLYNATARDFGPVAEYNRFFCDCCDSTVMVDEDGLCTTCGGDTWGVFDPLVRARETAIAAAYPSTDGRCMKPSKYSDVAPCYNPLPCNAHDSVISSTRSAATADHHDALLAALDRYAGGLNDGGRLARTAADSIRQLLALDAFVSGGK